MHHQVYPCVPSVLSKNKGEPSVVAMSLLKPELAIVKSKAISLDTHKANNNKGELWRAVTAVSTDPMSTTDN